MGFTPLEGLMMGSRSGSVDPSILIHLMRQEGYTADKLDQLLNKASGLKGISGVSEDMRQITAMLAEGNPRAQLAFDILCASPAFLHWCHARQLGWIRCSGVYGRNRRKLSDY